MEEKTKYYIENDVLYKDELLFDNVYQTTEIITKEAFINCYKNWIKETNE